MKLPQKNKNNFLPLYNDVAANEDRKNRIVDSIISMFIILYFLNNSTIQEYAICR